MKIDEIKNQIRKKRKKKGGEKYKNNGILNLL